MTNKAEQPDITHEESDVSVSSIVKFGLALSVATGVVCLLVWGLFALFYASAAKTDTPPPSLYRGERLPPEPRLQGMPGHQSFPSEDIKEFRERETDELNSYGWVVQPSGQQAGIVHIPIERAKMLIAERGLPASPASAAQNRTPEKKQ
jgi:hypothetical protein